MKKEILNRAFREFWFPFLCASLWTGFRIHDAEKVTISDVIANASASFFFLSFLTGNYFRIKKQALVESSFTSVAARLETVVAKLEDQQKDLRGYAIGEGGWIEPEPILRGETLWIKVHNTSKYPVFDIILDVRNIDAAVSASSIRDHTYYYSEKIGQLYPTDIENCEFNVSLEGKISLRLDCVFLTRKNFACLEIRIVRTETGLAMAYRQFVEGRDPKSKIYVPDNFPGPASGSPYTIFAKPA